LTSKLAWPILWIALLAAIVCSPAFGLHNNVPVRHAHRGRRHWRRIAWNPMFRPSHDSLLRQNEEINRLELPRIADDDELEELKLREDLVQIRESQTLRFDPKLDPKRRYCKMWARDFVEDLSQAYYRQFHSQLQVNSAVRTIKVQHKLRRHNRNAAPEYGETASSHLAGLTLDLQRRGMTKQQVHFVERYLFYLRALGLVEPEEERHQWVFHVMVSARYVDWRKSQTMFAIAVPTDVDTVFALTQ
jgi:uncharacterized protein YcbK (DUF882 family)